MHADSPLGPVEFFFFAVFAIAALLTVLLVWLNLPRLYRAGPVTPAIDQAFRAVASAFGLVVLLTLVSAVVAILFGYHRPLSGALNDVAFYFCIPVAAACLLWRIGCALEHLHLEPAPSLPPRCEGCGYDLSHQPSDARCPECSFPVADSVSPRRRPGCRWERSKRRALREWFQTVQMVVLLPREFYRNLRLRTPTAPATTFAVRNYVAIGVGAGIWVLLMWWADVARVGSFVSEWDHVCRLFFTFVLWTPLGCWLGHRLGGAIVISWWIARRTLPDTRWAAKVLAYESAYLWVFCVFLGIFATTFVLAGKPWISDRFGTEFFFAVFRVPGEAVVLLGGTALLALGWLWRYVVALRAIRWSNY